MDTDAAVQAVVSIVDDGSATVVSGLTQNSVARQIEHLADTLLASPDAYYAVGVHCDGAREFTDPDVGNVNAATPYRTEYRMRVIVTDLALFEPGESLYGSTAHTNFRDLVKALVQLIRRDTEWFPDSSSSPRFRLARDPVRGREVSYDEELPQPVGDGTYMLGGTLQFTLHGCND